MEVTSLLRRLRVFVILAGVVLVVLLSSSARVYTDWLWFKSLGQVTVFWNTLAWRWAVRLSAAGVVILLIYLNLRLARRNAVRNAPFVQTPFSYVLSWPWAGWIALGAAVFLGVSYSAALGNSWEIVARFAKAVAFGIRDPLFGRDVGFYVFSLPFQRLLFSTATGVLVLTALASTGIYLLAGSVRFDGNRPAVEPGAKAHLSILLSALLLVKGWGYLLDMYDLVYSTRGVVFGAAYTDVRFMVPSLKVMAVAAVISAALMLVNLWRPGLRYALVSIGFLLAASLVLRGFLPGAVQKFVVEPDELNKEAPYIQNNIKYTRAAYGLEKVEERDFPATEDLRFEDIALNQSIIQNIRLWDWRPLLRTLGQLQEIRLYYDFEDVDVDRYTVDGDYRQVMVSPRELDVSKIQNRTWINEHLQYTHGYGIAMNPVNEVTREGLPVFFVSDIPPKAVKGLEVTRPEIYFGEKSDQYVIVKTRTPEFDYPVGDRNAQAFYQGEGGVRLSSWMVRAMFAFRMGTIKILLSDDITSESRIMFYRTIRERVQKLTPFLRFDSDPYVVLDQGKLFWIQDAYTLTDRYPYSQPVAGWGNYVRNSVKAVIDAYDGTTTYYVSDPDDPIIQTYSKIFPGLFAPLSEMPQGQRAHIRYPVNLFTVQAHVYSKYHMADTTLFYNQEDLWSIPREIVEGEEIQMEPYYIITALPGEPKDEMALILPFNPTGKDNMVAWLGARNDGENYGKLLLYKFPKRKLTYGPMQIEARIDQDAEISKALTLWGQRGSNVIRGNLLVIPVKNSLIYVEPLYLEAEKSRFPELKQVIMAYGTSIIMRPTISEAFAAVFNRSARELEDADLGETAGERGLPEIGPSPVTGVGPGAGAAAGLEELARRAVAEYDSALSRLKAGDWAAFGKALEDLRKTLGEIERSSGSTEGR